MAEKVRFQCSNCGKVQAIPLRRVHVFEAFVELEDVHPLLLECHDCHAGAMVPESYVKKSGFRVAVDPQSVDPDTPVFRV